jgi:hypothetical protein
MVLGLGRSEIPDENSPSVEWYARILRPRSEPTVYSSLDKIDIVVEDGPRRLAVQTDHRDATEIAEEADVSRVFLALRVRNPLLSKQVDAVRIAFAQSPPEDILTFARRCGAEVQVSMQGDVLPPTPDDGVMQEVEEAWLRVGAALFAEEGEPATLEGLQRVERSLRTLTGGGPDTEFAVQYWTNVLRLGGAAAVVMKTMFGGKLHADDDVVRGLSYRWSHDGGLTNLFGRAASFLDDEPDVAPSALVRMTSENAEEGDVMLSLRAPGWPGVGMALTLPILTNTEKLGDLALPILAVVTDLPTATKTFPPDAPDVEGLRARAIANNRKHEVQIDKVEREDGTILIVHGHYYAAERLFDVEFMKELAARLGSPLLMASVPRRGVLLVRGLADVDGAAAFMAITQGQHERATPTDRLSTEVLLLSEGAVAGVARATSDSPEKPPPPPPKKKSLWQRFFGGENN